MDIYGYLLWISMETLTYICFLLVHMWPSLTYIARLRGGGPKRTIKGPNRDLIRKTLARHKTTQQSAKYNAKLVEYSPFTAKCARWGAEGALDGNFGCLGAGFD